MSSSKNLNPTTKGVNKVYYTKLPYVSYKKKKVKGVRKKVYYL